MNFEATFLGVSDSTPSVDMPTVPEPEPNSPSLHDEELVRPSVGKPNSTTATTLITQALRNIDPAELRRRMAEVLKAPSSKRAATATIGGASKKRHT